MSLRQLAARKAALTRHFGPDDPRAQAAAAELRVARLKAVITAEPLTSDEREELAAVLLNA